MHSSESMKKVKKYMNTIKVGQLLENDVNTDCYKEEFKVYFRFLNIICCLISFYLINYKERNY